MGQAKVVTLPGKLDTRVGFVYSNLRATLWLRDTRASRDRAQDTWEMGYHGVKPELCKTHGSAEHESQLLPNHHHELGADVARNGFVSEAARAAGLAGADGGAPLCRQRGENSPRRGRAVSAGSGVLWESWFPPLWTLASASQNALEFLRCCHDSSGSAPDPAGALLPLLFSPPRASGGFPSPFSWRAPPPLPCSGEAGPGFVDRKCFLYLSL